MGSRLVQTPHGVEKFTKQYIKGNHCKRNSPRQLRIRDSRAPTEMRGVTGSEQVSHGIKKMVTA